MAPKRVLFRTLADDSLGNARRLFADAKRLKRVGSRGHAIAFAVLSIEESSKALLYREVAEGVLRIVRKNPNHLTTFTEGEILDHRFKHGLLSNAILEWIRYGTFYEVAEGLRKPRYSRAEVRDIVLRAVHAHRITQIELQSESRAAHELKRQLDLLAGLNDLKNRGLYVDHIHGKISRPSDIRPSELEAVLDLSKAAIEISAEALRRNYSEREKRLQRDANKALLATIRRARRRTAATVPSH
jgi:AbiV family abortive infection protein